MVARHRAQAVADLAALAAAARLRSGSSGGLREAAVVARGMRVDDIGCVVDGLDVIITARVRGRLRRRGQAAARAGPATGEFD